MVTRVILGAFVKGIEQIYLIEQLYDVLVPILENNSILINKRY